LLGANAAELPVTALPPSFDDEGSHLAYAIQWFSFALIGLVGYLFLIRRSARPSH
jgi:surfeit locus 1 family protein